MTRTAIVIGGSDGIGLATTRRLIERGWSVHGLSRSPSPVEEAAHDVVDACSQEYPDALRAACDALGHVDACLHFAGIGRALDPESFAGELAVFETNLLSLVRTCEVVVPRMLAAGSGHLLALSSIADDLVVPGAPAYPASKAAMTSYLTGLAFALRPRGIHVTNVRFGFVDTKLARARWRPMMISVERSAELVTRCLERKPIQFTYPKTMAALVQLTRAVTCLRTWVGR